MTIAGGEFATADAYATTAFAMGLAGADRSAALPGYEALLLLADSRLLSTPGFPFAPDSAPPARPRLQLRIAHG